MWMVEPFTLDGHLNHLGRGVGVGALGCGTDIVVVGVVPRAGEQIGLALLERGLHAAVYAAARCPEGSVERGSVARLAYWSAQQNAGHEAHKTREGR